MTSDEAGRERQPPVLDYRTPAPRGRRWGKVLRGGMLGMAIVAILLAAACLSNPVLLISPVLGGGVMGTPFSPIDADLTQEQIQEQYIFRAAAYFALFLLVQWWFLSPKGSWRLALAGDAPPSRRSAIAAGFMGMLLSVGMLATLMELPEWWLMLTTKEGLESSQRFGVVWVVMGILWAFWTGVFWWYWKSLDRYTALRRTVRWLVAGSVLEMLVAGPAHAWIIHERGDECYCQRGTWTGVAFGCTAILWLFGPGAFLLFMRERRRREGLI